MDKKTTFEKTTFEMEEYISLDEIRKIYEEEMETDKAYPEEMLLACQNGKPCSYGICDECPNVLGIDNGKDEEENDKN